MGNHGKRSLDAMKLVRKMRRFSTGETQVDMSLKELEHHMMSYMTQGLSGKPWQEFWLAARDFVWKSGDACAHLQQALPLMIQKAEVREPNQSLLCSDYNKDSYKISLSFCNRF